MERLASAHMTGYRQLVARVPPPPDKSQFWLSLVGSDHDGYLFREHNVEDGPAVSVAPVEELEDALRLAAKYGATANEWHEPVTPWTNAEWFKLMESGYRQLVVRVTPPPERAEWWLSAVGIENEGYLVREHDAEDGVPLTVDYVNHLDDALRFAETFGAVANAWREPAVPWTNATWDTQVDTKQLIIRVPHQPGKEAHWLSAVGNYCDGYTVREHDTEDGEPATVSIGDWMPDLLAVWAFAEQAGANPSEWHAPETPWTNAPPQIIHWPLTGKPSVRRLTRED